MTTLTVLGGSSPFTAALVDSLRDLRPALAPRNLVLHGRNGDNLEAVGHYARSQLGPMGWSVRTTTGLEDALEGSSVVVHQIRYGGLEGRASDEQFATSQGLPADETLGPAGLRAAIRMAPSLQRLAVLIRRCCPSAWVLNLTNPLSVATTILSRGGVSRCLGLCELPLITAREACRVLDLPADEVDWSYTGLNHRGFIHQLIHRGKDHIPDLPGALGRGEIGGIGADLIAELGALPLKYFRFAVGRAPAAGGRAAYLMKLRDSILEELRRSPSTSPPSLEGRDLQWYPQSVVPMLAALDTADGRVAVVNVLAGGKTTSEVKARVFADHLEITPAPRPGDAVTHWLKTFTSHERAVIEAALEPSRTRIEVSLAADPMVPSSRVKPMARALSKAGSFHSRRA